jgi:ribosome-binding protein aMBF1 (putative translation factor)
MLRPRTSQRSRPAAAVRCSGRARPVFARSDKTLRCIAANVVRIRMSKGLTHEALAEAAGLDLRHLQRIERGGADFRVSALVALGSALEIPITQLLRATTLAPGVRGRPRQRGRRNR